MYYYYRILHFVLMNLKCIRERKGVKGLVRVSSSNTVASRRASFLNIGLVKGSVRAVRSKEFSMSSKLSDRLCE